MKKYNYEKDGITQGALAMFQTCREKTRLFYEGWTPKRESPALVYGSIVHGVLELVYDDVRKKKLTKIPSSRKIGKYVDKVGDIWTKERKRLTPQQREFLEVSLGIAEAIMPTYFSYWWKEDLREIKWKNLESQFDIPYRTSTGYRTRLRGKKDGIFTNPRMWLFETKTKSILNEGNLLDTLWFEFQVNFYLFAMRKTTGKFPAGVLYNIIRKSSLYRRKHETLAGYAKRVADDVARRPEFYFVRFEVVVKPDEMRAFEKELDALVIEFIRWLKGKGGHYKNTGACESKYGSCPFLPICSSQDYTEFFKRDSIYRELEDM